MSRVEILEIIGALCSIIYSLLLMKEKKSGWWFGIASSCIGTVLFFQTKLYAQACISIYFAFVGIYGWWYWNKAEKRNEHIHTWTLNTHLLSVVIFCLLSWISAYLFKTYTESSSPYFDSFITLFGLLASIKEARKVLSSWIYWLVINLCSAVLYYEQGLVYYSILMIVYAGICIPGYLSWLNIYRRHLNTQSIN